MKPSHMFLGYIQIISVQLLQAVLFDRPSFLRFDFVTVMSCHFIMPMHDEAAGSVGRRL